MNCEECREELAAYLESLLDAATQSRLKSHLAECPACQVELGEVQELMVRLARDGAAAPPVSLETEVMNRILHQQALELRRLKMRRRIRILGISGATAAAVAILFASSFWVTGPAVAESQQAAKVLAQGAEAVPDPSTVHIVAKMRTLPGEWFDVIDADGELVPVDVWRQFRDHPKWRIEKPGYMTVMDGMSATTFQPPDHACRHRASNRWPVLLLELAEVRGMLGRELAGALANGWDLRLTHEITAAGDKKLVVSIETRCGWPESNYAKDKLVDSSDMRRVYRFDAKTQRLEGFDAYLHRPGGDVLVVAIERIDYDEVIDPGVFVLKLPAKVQLVDYRKDCKEPAQLPDNEKYEIMTPKEAARAFFEACAKEDWDEVQKFDTTPVTQEFKDRLGGLQVLRLGEPFQVKRSYYGWYIPYEIKLKDGKVKKFNLAMRKDNPAKRYVWDGGLDYDD